MTNATAKVTADTAANATKNATKNTTKNTTANPMAPGLMIAILPCNDLDASERFCLDWASCVSMVKSPEPVSPKPTASCPTARAGICTSPSRSKAGLLGRNPFGLYLRIEEVDELAAEFATELAGKKRAENKPWGMYEFALSDPDETLV